MIHFDEFAGDNITLHLVSKSRTKDFQHEVIKRVDQAERSTRRADYQLDPIGSPRADIGSPELHPLIWKVPDGRVSIKPFVSSLTGAADKDLSRYVAETEPEPLLEDLQNAQRSPGEHLLFMIMGLDAGDSLNPLVISKNERVFRDPANFVHVYSVIERHRTVRDLKRYRRQKEKMLDYIKRGEMPMAEPTLENMDTLLYFMDRMGWTYRTHIHPEETGRATPFTFDTGAQHYEAVKETAVFENQTAFTDVEEKGMCIESI